MEGRGRSTESDVGRPLKNGLRVEKNPSKKGSWYSQAQLSPGHTWDEKRTKNLARHVRLHRNAATSVSQISPPAPPSRGPFDRRRVA